MILCVLLFLLILVVEYIVQKCANEYRASLITHVCLISMGAFFMLYQYSALLMQSTASLQPIPSIVCGVVGVMIYVVDLAVKNMILNDVLILDIKYYFTPKKNQYFVVVLSLIIACGEELAFRLPLCEINTYTQIVLIVGSVVYGMTHIYFSKYDMISKIIFGFILGIVCLGLKNMLYALIIHIVYNMAVGLFGGLNFTKD